MPGLSRVYRCTDVMDTPLLTPEVNSNLTIEQRMELVLNLTRRVELLDDLLRSARARRCEIDAEYRLAEVEQTEVDAVLLI